MPVPLEVSDTWTGSDGASWDARWTIRNVAGSSPAPTILSGHGRMLTDPAETHDDRVIAYLAPTIENLDLTVRITCLAADNGTTEIGYRVGTNITSGTPTDGYSLAITPQSGTINLYKINSYDYFSITHDALINDTDPHWYRLRVKGSSHRVKWWADGAAQPPSWNIDATDATYTSGQIFLGTYNEFTAPGGVSTWDQVVLDWDDFSLLELLPPDPGFRVGEEPVVAMYVGAEPVVTAYKGTVEVPVTWPP